MDIRVAVLVDGSFFLKRLQYFKRKYFASQIDLDAAQTVNLLNKIARKHLNGSSRNDQNYQHLYRLFFYDSPPLDIKAHLPLSEEGERNKRSIDFSKDSRSIYRKEVLSELKKQRKFALRLGSLKHEKQWLLNNHTLNRLIKGEIEFSQVTNDDFHYSVRQKGVDIKLGVDIATLSQQKLVDKIVLIAGDSDFVPAAKLARIQGIDFVLDPLRNNIDPTLHEHIDGLMSYDIVNIMTEIYGSQPDIRPTWWNDKPVRKKKKSRRKSN